MALGIQPLKIMLKKLLQPKIVFIFILLLIIIFLIIAKISSKQSTNQTNQIPTKNTSVSSSPNNSSSKSISPIPTIVNIGPTNSSGDPMFYETQEESDSFYLVPTIDTSYVLPSISQEEGDDTDVDLDFPLAQILPYQGVYFRTTRYIGVNNLEIIVPRKDQTDLAKKEAQEWLIKNGVEKYDRFTVVYK